MQITAAVARAPNAPFSLESLDLAEPREDEILVRVVAAGVCHTDIAMRDGVYPVPLPIVLGHEGAGVVERVGRAITKVAVGDHVAMSYHSCGQCACCREHAPNYCEQAFALNFSGARPDGSSALSQDGRSVHGHFFGQSSFATHALCHERNVVKVRKDMPLELLGPLGCGLMTGAGSVINNMKIAPGRSLAVFGVGAVGMAAVMAARLVGAGRIIAVDLTPSRLDLAKELGASDAIDATRGSVVETILSLSQGGVDFAFDTTGAPVVLRQAVESLARRGTCVTVGASKPGVEVSLDMAQLMTGGRQLRGVIEGDAVPDVFIPQLIEFHRQGRFPFDRLIRFYPFDQINAAVADSLSGRTIKPVLLMSTNAN
jgi:aryl-alcohol dehydrogenase